MSRRSRAALFVPVVFSTVAVAALVISIGHLASRLSAGGILGVVVSGVLALIVVSDLRVVFVLDGSVRVRSLFQQADFDARVCSFTVTTVQHARSGPNYDVSATDGDVSRRTKVSFHFSQRGAARAVQRLSFGVLGHEAGNAQAAGAAVVATLRHEKQAKMAMARAYMASASRTPFQRALPWIVMGVAIVLAVATSLLRGR